MIFVDNFLHGDLHPGNILVQSHESSDDFCHMMMERVRRAVRLLLTTKERNVVQKMQAQIWCDRYLRTSLATDVEVLRHKPMLVMLDAGITVQLSEFDRRNFRDLFKVRTTFTEER